MEVTVQGKQMDVGDALRTHVGEKLSDINNKYFNHAAFAAVTFSTEGHGHGLVRAHIQIQIGKDIFVMADNVAGDAYGAFDTAADKVAKQMRRYKKRLRDHHDRMEQAATADILSARDYTIAPDAEEEENAVPQGEDPVIVAESATDIRTMSVSDAVMRMDLAGQTALLFRNARHGGLNMVYRRPDGNIGWVDPVEAGQAKTA